VATAFEELEGSPTIQISDRGVTGTRVFRVAWSDWRSFAEELIGGFSRVGGTVTFREGKPFPGLPQALVTEVRVQPMDPANPDGTGLAGPASATNSYTEGGAKLTVRYATRENDQTGDGSQFQGILPGTLLTYSQDLGSELLAVPGTSWQWASDAKQVKADLNVGVLVGVGQHIFLWERVARPPWETIRSHRGKVNSVDFPLPGTTAEPESLLFLGAQAERKFEFLGNASLWDIEYHFAEKSAGWNKFFRAGQGFQKIEQKDNPGQLPYDTADLTQLFQFGS